MIAYPPIPFFTVKGKVHSLPLTLDPKNLKQILDGSRLHKAKTATEKMKMCLSQSGKTTTIYTGVCVINQGKTFTDSTATKITYMNFNAAMLDNAHNHNPNRRNAALGFHVDSTGFALIEKIEGSYMGALGLPLDKMYNLLKKAGYDDSRN